MITVVHSFKFRFFSTIFPPFLLKQGIPSTYNKDLQVSFVWLVIYFISYEIMY